MKTPNTQDIEPTRHPEPADRPKDARWQWTGRAGVPGGRWSRSQFEPTYTSYNICLREDATFKAYLHTGGDGPALDGPDRSTLQHALADVDALSLLLEKFQAGECRHETERQNSRVRALIIAADLLREEAAKDADHRLGQPDHDLDAAGEVADCLTGLADRVLNGKPADALLWVWPSREPSPARGPHGS